MGTVNPSAGSSQLPSSVFALPHWPTPFPAVAHTSVAHAQSTRGAASRRHSWGSITGQRSMGPSLAGSACETEGCDLRGGWGGFIAPRLPLPRRGGSLFSAAPWFPFQRTVRTGDGWESHSGTRAWRAGAWCFPCVQAPPALTLNCWSLQTPKTP